MSNDAMQEAKQLIKELIEAAQTGALIPIRLPGQLEAIADSIAKAEDAHTEELRSNSAPPEMEEYMAEEAYFVGHAVHELRTPMTSIRGYSDMLGSMGELNDMQKQFLDVIRTNTKRMESLLSDMSYINKIRKNTLKLAVKMDMFKNIAMKLEKDFTPLAEELNRKIEFDIPQGLPLLNTDGDLFAIALGKFLENSIRYSPENEGIVTVRAIGEDGNLVVEIADNGIGITDDDMAQLGNIYFRADHDVVRQFKGSGLGIPIAFGLLEAIGAEWNIQSEAEQGTRIYVRIAGMS